jgi:hypothetical protein
MDYDWVGYGLVLRFDHGTVWLQGDEASELYDQLGECESSEQVELLLDEYSELAEEEV